MKYFLDTSVIIDFVNKKEEAISKLKEILEQNDSEIYINRLVEIESLRTITYKQESSKQLYTKTKKVLDGFTKLDINQKIYSKAVDFSRFCQSKGISIKGKCAAIDFLHFITAKEYNLEIISFDNDLQKLEEQYMEFVRKGIV